MIILNVSAPGPLVLKFTQKEHLLYPSYRHCEWQPPRAISTRRHPWRSRCQTHEVRARGGLRSRPPGTLESLNSAGQASRHSRLSLWISESYAATLQQELGRCRAGMSTKLPKRRWNAAGVHTTGFGLNGASVRDSGCVPVTSVRQNVSASPPKIAPLGARKGCIN